MYVHECIASVTRPVMELEGFERIHLDPGQRKTIKFPLGPKQLSLLNADMHWVVEPGTFDLMVGPSSAQTTSLSLVVTEVH